jgi:hypothetical protein
LSNSGLLDESPEAKSNYSKTTIGDIADKMLTVERIMRWLLKLVGFRRYAQLIKLAAWLGRFEHHRFLLDKWG